MQVARVSMVVVALVLGVYALAQAGDIAWLSSYDETLQQAKQSGKLVMVNFYTDW